MKQIIIEAVLNQRKTLSRERLCPEKDTVQKINYPRKETLQGKNSRKRHSPKKKNGKIVHI